MKQIQHFFIDADLSKNELSVRDSELIHQMKNVLRFRVGDPVILLDNLGIKAVATLTELHHKEARFAVGRRERFVPPTRALRLIIALPKKPATLEWILEKATELGVTDIHLLDSARCQVHELRKKDRLELIIKEAAEQCERVFKPILHDVFPLDRLVDNPPSGLLLAGDPWTYDAKLSEVNTSGDVNIIIGPEGGLTDEELQSIRVAGGTLFQLGDLVLRMETAAIAALSVVQFG